MNPYEVLGVARTATADEIKRAYRGLASRHHPDKGGDTARFQEIQSAYDILSNPEKRAEYDNPPAQHFHFGGDFGGVDLNDIFAQFGFNPMNGRFTQQRAQRNRDVRFDVHLTLRDTLEDQTRTFSIKTHNGERREVDLRIPAGVTSGTQIKYPGLGDNRFTNVPAGDLYAQIHVQADPNFEVQGLDLVTGLTIDCFAAILGTEQTVTGLDGTQFVIRTPRYCQPGTKLKIAGHGLPAYGKDVKGNLYVRINISIPRQLSEPQLELIKTIQTNQ